MRCKYAICIHVTAQKFFPEIFRSAKNQICIFFKSTDKILYFLCIIRICIFYFPTIYDLTILTSGTDNSIFSNEANFNKFIKKPTVKAIEKDPMTAYVRAKYDLMNKLGNELAESMKGMDLLHKTYVRGLCEMYSPEPKAPDANFTMRLTYGNVKSYSPRDAVHYDYYTTTDGILEKENPEDREFVVPAKLKELIQKKDFGRYAMADGTMPVCFLTTNDITGGNSGSPVINGEGQLIGTAFDGNWESLSGDINFNNDLQRCIALDIRYVLFILDKLGNCSHLIKEMNIIE